MTALLFRGPVFGSSGYASAARAFLLHLMQTDLKLGLQTLHWRSGFDIYETRDVYLRLKALEKQRLIPEQSVLLNWTIASEFAGRQDYAYGIGHTVFETDSLLQSFVAGCNQMDALIIPSEFNRQNFQRAGVKVPMHIVHEGVDTSFYHPDGPALAVIPPRFTFLAIAQISYRKGLDLVLKAFLELFAQHEDVQLVLRCYFKDGSPQDIEQVKQFVQLFREREMQGLKSGHIFLVTNLAQQMMPALYRSGHVLLAPFRGEGWGLTLTEAMATELPVIATNWGGATEYLSPEIATLLNYELKPIPTDIPDYFLGGHLQQARAENHRLAEPDFEYLKRAMLDSYQNYFLYKAKAVQARETMLSSFQWHHAVAQFLEVLKGQ